MNQGAAHRDMVEYGALWQEDHFNLNDGKAKSVSWCY